jgi:hypothetical protein
MQLVAIKVADPPNRWEALGFAVDDGACVLGGVRIELGASGRGMVGWTLAGLPPQVDLIDGLPTEHGEMAAAEGSGHPNHAIGVDHVVITTPDFDRTAAVLGELGMPLRRVRDAGGFRQGFRRLGPAILELVELQDAPPGPARFWGLVVIVPDLEALASMLGEHLGTPKAAVQPGRSIATVRRSAGLSTALAFMTPEP